MSSESHVKALAHQFWIAFFFEILLPILFAICLFFPMNYLFNKEFMFERVFASSDLILLSAVFLVSTANQIHFETRFNGVESRSEYFCWPILFFAILWFVLFGFCKYLYINYDFPPSGGQVSQQITLIATWSIFSVVAASVTSIFFKILYYSKKKQLSELNKNSQSEA